MTLGELTSADAVIATTAEYDQLAREKFLKKYELGGAT
jgi:hypothetical protein